MSPDVSVAVVKQVDTPPWGVPMTPLRVGGFNRPGGVPVAPQCHTAVTQPDQHHDVPQPRPTRPWWHMGGDPRGPPVPGRPGATQGPPASPSPRVSASFRGSRSPNSLGGRQTRRLGRNRHGGGSVRTVVAPRWCRPSPEPKGGRRGRVWHTTHCTALLGHPGAPAPPVPADRGARGSDGSDPPQPRDPLGSSPPYLWVYVTSSAVSSGARLICS